MSTRAELAIQTEAGTWQHIYVHFDGYPSAMMPALAAHDPQEIIDAKEIRAITPIGIEPFKDPREPILRAAPRKSVGIDHLYIHMGYEGWKRSTEIAQ
jgi:hypothetical protein